MKVLCSLIGTVSLCIKILNNIHALLISSLKRSSLSLSLSVCVCVCLCVYIADPPTHPSVVKYCVGLRQCLV